MMTNKSLPMPITVKPYLHQQQAFDFACMRFGLLPSDFRSNGVALLMEMGTGKTITSIGISGILYQFGRVNRILVVAPLSILGVWEEEFEKFAAFPYTLTILKGTSAKKRQQLSEVGKTDGLEIVVVNYESARILEPELLKFNADLIIADEGHKLKENRSQQSKTMHTLGDHARYKLLLTGTLITNREIDAYSQYRYLNSRIFGTSFYAFRNRFFFMSGYGQHTPVFKKEMTGDYLRPLHSIAFRVTKAECLDLPEITEEIRTIDLEPKALKLYQKLEEESFAELRDSEVTAPNILTKLLRLSQVTGGHLTDDERDTHMVSTAKLDALSDIIDTAVSENKKLVVMARFVPELNDIQALLEKKKIGYAVVRGGVKDRAEEVRRFQNDDDCRVFIGQIAAAGLGITLTAASTMVFYSLDYSMSNFDQAKARIHRVGQRENCHYIYLIARGTVDRKILRSLRDKIDLAKTLVDDYRKGKQSVRWMPMDKWDACAFPVNPEELEGRVCYGGLDLSSTTDLTSFCLVFPPEDEYEPYYILPYFWLPEDTLPLRVNRDHVPYDLWERQGFIQTTEGNVVHYGFIEKFIEKLGEVYNIREIAFDRWGAVQMVQNLEGMGFTVVPMGQGFASMSPPTKELMKLTLEKKLAHGGHPVLRWNMDNIFIRTDPAGNIKADKAKSTEKIDGAIACIMALDRAIRCGNDTSESVYDTRGLLVF